MASMAGGSGSGGGSSFQHIGGPDMAIDRLSDDTAYPIGSLCHLWLTAVVVVGAVVVAGVVVGVGVAIIIVCHSGGLI